MNPVELVEKYYYIRDFDNSPKITLCQLEIKNTRELCSLGVAVCSRKDFPNKKIGKEIARGRAVKNLIKRKIFSQQELQKVKTVKNLLNENYNFGGYTPKIVKTLIELMGFSFDKNYYGI